MIEEIILKLIDNFDFTYMLVINVLTYIIIQIIQTADINVKMSVFLKRIILICSILLVTCLYKIFEYKQDNIILINSAILSPVFWSWVIRPIFNKFNIGYKR